MTYEERQKKLDKALTNKNTRFNIGGHEFTQKDLVRYAREFKVDSIRKAAAYLYATYLACDPVNPEAAVANAHPTVIDPEYVVPRDAYLMGPAARLGNYADLGDFESFLRVCDRLSRSDVANAISVHCDASA